MKKFIHIILVASLVISCAKKEKPVRITEDFNADWYFILNPEDSVVTNTGDSGWRQLNLPHDWSIEGEFSESHPAGIQALHCL